MSGRPKKYSREKLKPCPCMKTPHDPACPNAKRPREFALSELNAIVRTLDAQVQGLARTIALIEEEQARMRETIWRKDLGKINAEMENDDQEHDCKAPRQGAAFTAELEEIRAEIEETRAALDAEVKDILSDIYKRP